MFAVLQFPPPNFLISFLVCIILRVSLLLIRWHVFSAWVAWCLYFKFLLVICFFDICSSNVVSDGLHFSESNYLFLWEYLFKVDAPFNMLMIFFLKYFGKIFQCWSSACNHYCLLVLDFFNLRGVRHGFLPTCLLRAFSVWSYHNLVLSLNIHYFSWCNEMYGDVWEQILRRRTNCDFEMFLIRCSGRQDFGLRQMWVSVGFGKMVVDNVCWFRVRQTSKKFMVLI